MNSCQNGVCSGEEFASAAFVMHRMAQGIEGCDAYANGCHGMVDDQQLIGSGFHRMWAMGVIGTMTCIGDLQRYIAVLLVPYCGMVA